MNVKPSHSMLVNSHLNFSVWSVHLQLSRCIKASFDASASKKYSYLFSFCGSLPVKHNLILSFVLPSGQNASFSHGFSRYFWHAVLLSRQTALFLFTFSGNQVPINKKGSTKPTCISWTRSRLSICGGIGTFCHLNSSLTKCFVERSNCKPDGKWKQTSHSQVIEN